MSFLILDKEVLSACDLEFQDSTFESDSKTREIEIAQW